MLGNWIIKMNGKILKEDLDRMLSGNGTVIVLGENFYWEEIFLLSVNSTCGASEFWIAIYSGSSINPSIYSYEARERLIIGYNHDVAIVDLCTHKVIFEKELCTSFYFAKYIGSLLVVISEIDVFIISDDNKEIFHQSSEIIESFKFSESLLMYTTNLGEQTIDLSSMK